MKLLLIAIAGLVLSFSEASAQAVDPQCRNMRDQVGCTCAVQNGGYVQGTRWFTGSGGGRGRNARSNEAYTQCLIRAGRK